MKKNRLHALVTLALVLAMMLTLGIPAMAETPDPVTITIGGWPTPDNADFAYMEELKATFSEMYPYIEVITDEYLYEADTFLPKAASGQLPNIYRTWFTETEKIMGAGYAADITDSLEKHGLLEAINPDLLPLVEKDGRYFGIPVSGYSMSMMYNVAVFEEAGLLDENGVPLFPTTWDEVAETAVAIKEKTGKTGFFYPTTSNHGGWMFMNLAWSYGAAFETLVDGKWTATFDSEEAVAALQYLMDLRWKHDVLQSNILVDLSEFVLQYGTDQAAMGLCHIPMTRSIVNNTGMSKDNFAVSTTPEGPAGQAALLGGDVYMFAPGTTEAQMDALMLWMDIRSESPKFSEEAEKGLRDRLTSYTEQGYPIGAKGLRIWVDEDRLAAEDAIYDEFVNVDMKLWSPYDDNASKNLRAEEPVNCQELYKILDSVIQEVLTNENADPQALLTKACEDFQRDYLDKAN